jgi:hypothetical protein
MTSFWRENLWNSVGETNGSCFCNLSSIDGAERNFGLNSLSYHDFAFSERL